MAIGELLEKKGRGNWKVKVEVGYKRLMSGIQKDTSSFYSDCFPEHFGTFFIDRMDFYIF